MTAPLIPWNSGAVFVSSTLGVPTIAYAPFAFSNWLAPLIDLLWGFLGWFTPKAREEEIAAWHNARAPIIITESSH
jgi:NhaC family Na+:H+ antiporter